MFGNFFVFLLISVLHPMTGKPTMLQPLEIISRTGWNALPSKGSDPMPNPVPYVVIHHSYIPPACHTLDDCCQAMLFMQDLHQNTNGWNDIGYHFAVGGDGRAYEGRGWSLIGAHAPGYNNISIGICVIGDWREELPPDQQLTTVKNLIAYGVDQGMIRENYKLIGHRQARDTECPGDRLFSEITTWEHFLNTTQLAKHHHPKPSNLSDEEIRKKLHDFHVKKSIN